MNFIKIIKKAIYREKYNSETYIKYLRRIGIRIGEDCIIYVPTKTLIDIQNPYMIEIGNNVKIAEGVKILTHDFSWCVTSGIDGYITGSVGSVNIGNNVFIGMNAIILKNVKIGDNVIIGAGSIVTHDCDDNYVYAGNPAKKIMTVNEYHEKRKKNEIKDARIVVKKYFDRYGKLPDEKVLREFVFVFNGGKKKFSNIVDEVLEDSGHYKLCKQALEKNNPQYKNLEEFLMDFRNDEE